VDVRSVRADDDGRMTTQTDATTRPRRDRLSRRQRHAVLVLHIVSAVG